MATLTSPASSPEVDHARLLDVTKDAVDFWLVDSRTVKTQDNVDRNLTFRHYNLSKPHIDKLSKFIIDVATAKTGVKFNLAPSRLRKFSQDTIDKYINDSVRELMDVLPGAAIALPDDDPKTPLPKPWDPFQPSRSKKSAVPVLLDKSTVPPKEIA
jgi:hypothetical protein